MRGKNYLNRIYIYLLEFGSFKSSYEVSDYFKDLNNRGHYQKAIGILIKSKIILQNDKYYFNPNNKENEVLKIVMNPLFKGFFGKNKEITEKILNQINNKKPDFKIIFEGIKKLAKDMKKTNISNKFYGEQNIKSIKERFKDLKK